MSSKGGKLVVALTFLLVGQHGVRHLLLADDSGKGQSSEFRLLDSQHPFPSLPLTVETGSRDLTPVEISVRLNKGDVLAIGSLDRSVGQHEVSVRVRPANGNRKSDSPSVDVSIIDPGQKSSRKQSFIRRHSSGGQSVVSALKPAVPEQPSGIRCSATRRFQLPYFRGGQVYARPLILANLGENDSVVVYGTNQPNHQAACGKLLDLDIDVLLSLIRDEIHDVSDLDGNQRLTFVLGQLSDRVAVDQPTEPIRGCVRPADFRPHQPFGGDIIYLDPEHLISPDSATTGPAEPDDADAVQALLVHELAHAATFSLLVDSGQTPTSMPGWLNEAIAHFVEEQVDSTTPNLADRRRLFFAKTWFYPAVIPESVTAMELRRGPARMASLELLKSLEFLKSSDLATLIKSRGNGVDRLLAATEKDFDTVFRNYTVWLYREYARSFVHEAVASRAGFDDGGPELKLAFAVEQDAPPSRVFLRGTAVAYGRAAQADCQVTVKSTVGAKLQLSVLRER